MTEPSPEPGRSEGSPGAWPAGEPFRLAHALAVSIAAGIAAWMLLGFGVWWWLSR